MRRAALLRRSGQFALSRGRTDCRVELNRVAGADNDPIVGNKVVQRPGKPDTLGVDDRESFEPAAEICHAR